MNAIGTMVAAVAANLIGRSAAPLAPGMLTAAAIDEEFRTARVGQQRKSGRRAVPANSNDPLIGLLVKNGFPNLLTEPVTVARIAAIQRWLRTQPEVHYRDDESMARAIRRAKQRARRAK